MNASKMPCSFTPDLKGYTYIRLVASPVESKLEQKSRVYFFEAKYYGSVQVRNIMYRAPHQD